MIGLIHNVIGSFHVCYVYRGALRRLMHTEVCIGLDIAHFPSLMYGFIMQQINLYTITLYTYNNVFNIIDLIQSKLLAINQLNFAKVSPFSLGLVQFHMYPFTLG